jgi:glycosyltransferase involved in cell wall biosynthesis
MKIAIFYNLAFGGAKRVVLEHTRGLKKRGHSVDVYTVNSEKDIFDPSALCDNLYNYKVNLESETPVVNRFISDYRNFFSLKKIHQKIAHDIDTGDYDIVLVHPDRFTQAPFVLRFLKTPSAYYCQEPLRIAYEYSLRLTERVNILKRIYENATRKYRKEIDIENVRSSTHTIASCYHVRERMIESYGVYPKVVYCGVNDRSFKPQDVKKVNQVFFVGATNIWEDGYDLVKDAIGIIPKNIRPNLKIVSWKKANGQRLSEKELVEIYNKSIATLCTSRLETFGLVPLESMSCGTPVIATRVSGHRETILDGKTGFLVDFDPHEIAKCIILLIEKPSKAHKMGRLARKHIEKSLTWDKVINDLEAALKGFIAK